MATCWRSRRGRDRFGQFHAIEQLRPGDEGHAQAGHCEQHAAIARVILHVMKAAFHGADRDGIGHQIRLEPRLDREKSGEALQHGTNR